MKLFLKYEEECLPYWPTGLLKEMGIAYNKDIILGEILLNSMLTAEEFDRLQKKLHELKFTILFDRKDILIQKIKYIIWSMLETDEMPPINTSVYISDQLNLNYTYLANIFSKSEDITIERFFILQKIEKAKSLLKFHDYEIKQIASTLNYSSIGHFSNQFKKITGFTPTEYKQQAPLSPAAEVKK